MTFDYETAWIDAARPNYAGLPADVHETIAATAAAAGGLSQLADCSMPWPDDGGALRALFDRLPDADLAFAARVVYAYGHWWPGASLTVGAPELPGRLSGGHWKFSHYADQVLRERFELPARGDNGRGHGFSLAIIEGAIRVCHSSAHSWQWSEVAPATAEGMQTARSVRARLIRAGATVTDRRRKRDIENAIYQAFRDLDANPPAWPDGWTDLAHAGRRYLVDDAELDARKAARMPEPDARRCARRLSPSAATDIRDAEIERDGKVWLIDRGLPTDNCIFYSHTGRFAFGWRRTIADDLRARLDVALADFPFPFDFVVPR